MPKFGNVDDRVRSSLPYLISYFASFSNRRRSEENAIQHGDVSSSGPTLLASHIGPMLLEVRILDSRTVLHF